MNRIFVEAVVLILIFIGVLQVIEAWRDWRLYKKAKELAEQVYSENLDVRLRNENPIGFYTKCECGRAWVATVLEDRFRCVCGRVHGREAKRVQKPL